MTQLEEQGPDHAHPADPLTQATAWFMRLRAEEAGEADLTAFQRWVEESPAHAAAYTKVTESWAAIGAYASAPEIIRGRRDALEDAGRAGASRWRRTDAGRWRLANPPRWLTPVLAAACAAAVVLVGALTWWSQAHAGLYTTGVGERRTLTLADGSVVTLDARSRLQVKYGDHERLINLAQGQARFDVAKDPSRPFRVKAGTETVIALGTQFNVELVSRSVLVTLIEGRVAVLPDVPPRDAEPQIDLAAGEALQVHQDGKAVRLPRVDVNRVTAWQNGKMFFDNEPLASAAERVNRYATEQIQVDPAAANIGISGVFNAGDARAFIEAVTAYFPVKATAAHGTTVRLSARD